MSYTLTGFDGKVAVVTGAGRMRSIGRPIAVEGRKPDELMRELEAWIEAEMRRIDPQAYA